MANEGTPSYKYLDDKIKSISDKIELVDTRLDKLIKAHASDFTAQKNEILTTQRYLAALVIRVIHNETVGRLKKSALFPIFVAEATAAKIEIDKSETPITIAEEFVKKRVDDLEKSGIEYLDIPG